MAIIIPDIPDRDHWGMWANFFADAMKFKLQDSDGIYIEQVNNEEIDVYDGNYALERPHIYIVIRAPDIEERGMHPSYFKMRFKYRIVVESYDPDKNISKREALNILGDVIGLLANDRKLTIDGTQTARNLEFEAFDPIFVMYDELDDMYIWMALEIEIWKDL